MTNNYDEDMKKLAEVLGPDARRVNPDATHPSPQGRQVVKDALRADWPKCLCCQSDADRNERCGCPDAKASMARQRAAASAPKAELTAPDFAAWLAREMPAGTVIGDPAWWAPRIARAALAQAAPVAVPEGLAEKVAKLRVCEWGSGLEYYLKDDVDELLAAAPAAPVAAAVPAGWVSVDDRLPECDMKPRSLGVEVLIYPQFERGEHTAFYGCRCTDYPSFYKHGVVLGAVTHWQPLPAAPAPGASK